MGESFLVRRTNSYSSVHLFPIFRREGGRERESAHAHEREEGERWGEGGSGRGRERERERLCDQDREGQLELARGY